MPWQYASQKKNIIDSILFPSLITEWEVMGRDIKDRCTL